MQEFGTYGLQAHSQFKPKIERMLKSTRMEQIRTGLKHIMTEFLKTQPREEAAVLAWPLVCGNQIAARTRAVNFSEGRLTVEVPDTNWRSQLIAFVPNYLAGLASLLGPLVEEVHFQIARER